VRFGSTLRHPSELWVCHSRVTARRLRILPVVTNGSARPWRNIRVAYGGMRDGMPRLSHEEFMEWLAQQRQEVWHNLVRREEYRKDVDRLLRG